MKRIRSALVAGLFALALAVDDEQTGGDFMGKLVQIEADVTFIPSSEGGRETPPKLVWGGGSYRPHIVVGDPKQRRAVTIGNRIQETYLGVVFLSGPEVVAFSEPILVEMGLLYYPNPMYDTLMPGATFTIVGYGEVRSVLLPDA
jgi:hypothetical protein